jgi:hypothetical protein
MMLASGALRRCNVLAAELDKYASRCFSSVQLVQRPMPVVHLVAEPRRGLQFRRTVRGRGITAQY